MTDYKWLSAASLAITASLFEGGGRLLTARFIVRPKRYTPGNAIWHGVGHGGTESIYLSLMFINNIVFALMINSGQTGAVAAALPAGQFASISAALIQTPFWMFLIAGLERVMTLCVQIGLSVLAFEALRKKSVKIGLLMFLIHAVLDFAAPGMTMLGLSSNVGILLSEFVVLLFAVASVVMIRSASAEMERGKRADAPTAGTIKRHDSRTIDRAAFVAALSFLQKARLFRNLPENATGEKTLAFLGVLGYNNPCVVLLQLSKADRKSRTYALVAQSVEHLIGNEEVGSSNLLKSSIKTPAI